MTQIGYTIIQVATVLSVGVGILLLVCYLLPQMTLFVVREMRGSDRSFPVFVILFLISVLWLVFLGGIIAGIGELLARV